MKLVTVLFLLLIGATVALGEDQKRPDVRDWIPDHGNRLSLNGELTVNHPTWHRYSAFFPPDPTCNSPVGFDYGTEPYYDFYCFQVVDTEIIEMWCDPAGTGFDPVLYIYCDPFDAANSDQNLVAFDDDDGEDLMSAFTSSDAIVLTPGNNYWLVICAYSSGATGPFLIHTSDNIQLCGVPNETLGWGEIKNLYR